GTLNVLRDWTNAAAINVTSTGALTGNTLTNLASGTVTNLGNISVLVVNQGRYVTAGTNVNLQQTAGSLTVSGAATITGNATVTGGLFDLNGFNYTNALMVLAGSGALTSSQAGASFSGGLSNAATVAVSPGLFFKGVITNTGTVLFNGGVLSNNLVTS